MTLRREHAGLTDQGRARTDNQDRWYADATRRTVLVADGMGGGPAGGLAAEVVVDALPRVLRKLMGQLEERPSPAAVEGRLCSAIVELSDRLLAESRGEPGLAGMGSTVVVAVATDQHVLVAHMGDSRAYLLRGRRLEQLTRDHTIVQLLIESGDIRPEEAAEHPAQGQLTRFVGMTGEALPETHSCPGSREICCSYVPMDFTGW